MPGFRTELKRDQVLGGRRQNFVSGLSDQDHIFDPDSTFFRNVDAGLNRHDHPRGKFLGLAFAQPRRFMHLNSHSVPRGMGKKRVEARFPQHFPPCPVHFTCFHTRPYSSNRGELGLPDCLIHAAMRP